jgi:hypothetical protein
MKPPKLVNLTPDTLELVGSNWKLPPSGVVAKVSGAPVVDQLEIDDGEFLDAIEVYGRGSPHTHTYVYNRRDNKTGKFPEAFPGVLLVVSLCVRLANPGRSDLVNPAGYERDRHGGVTGFRYFEAWGKLP